MRYLLVDHVNGCQVGPSYDTIERAIEDWRPGLVLRRRVTADSPMGPLNDSEMNAALCALVRRGPRP